MQQSVDFQNIASRLQYHTITTYELDGKASFTLQHVKARTLLTVRRFDLFAKLYYIAHRDNDRQQALKVYSAHIMAFNPDGREPGRDDKNGVDDFIDNFDKLIDDFRVNEFDSNQSLIPVDAHGTILDGAHRVAALAFYDREVTIVRFEDVQAKCNFDYEYFKKRGLSWGICDIVALEMAEWLNDLYAACLWPRINDDEKRMVKNTLAVHHHIAYVKEMSVTLRTLKQFVGEIYSLQSWTKNPDAVSDKALRCLGHGRRMWVVFFSAINNDLVMILSEKEAMRSLLGHGKDTLHITDNDNETRQIAELVLSQDVSNSAMPISSFSRIVETLKERWFYFKHIQWIELKVKIYQIVKRIRKK